jgi:hypothetical protein
MAKAGQEKYKKNNIREDGGDGSAGIPMKRSQIEKTDDTAAQTIER